MIRKANCENDIKKAAEIYEKIQKLELEGVYHTGWKLGIYPTYKTADTAYSADELYVFEDENGNIAASAIINHKCPDSYKEGKWNTEADGKEILVLHTLSVDPDVKGKGIGKQFVAFYEDMARKLFCKTLRMDTNKTNSAARALYKKLGFAEVGIVPCEFNGLEGVNLVLLEKTL